MNYNRIIVYCDYGLDDAIATVHILKNSDMFERIDIVPIGGNVAADKAYKNAQTLLSEADKRGLVDAKKIRIVDTRRVSQPSADIPDVHGGDGMGDVFAPQQSGVEVVPFDAFTAELDKNKTPERDCVLSLGPCTVPNKIGYVPFCTILMGGATNEPPNYGKFEFNEALDPEAFSSFAKAATAVATLDTCHDEKFGFDKMKSDELTNALLASYRGLCEKRGCKIFAVYDYCAALAVTNPERFDAVRVRRADGAEYNELKLINNA